jgi:hypothetical protein
LWGGLIATAQTNGWFNRLRAGRMLVWGLVFPVVSIAIVALWRVTLRYQVFGL